MTPPAGAKTLVSSLCHLFLATISEQILSFPVSTYIKIQPSLLPPQAKPSSPFHLGVGNSPLTGLLLLLFFQFILIASVCHYTESSAENFTLAGIFSFITMLSKIDPALIPGIYTFPYIKVIFPFISPFFFPCLHLIYQVLLPETSNAQDTSVNQTDKNLDSPRAYLLVWKDSLQQINKWIYALSCCYNDGHCSSFHLVSQFESFFSDRVF